MRYRGWWVALLVALVLLAGLPSRAQAPAVADEFGTERVRFELFDEDARPYNFAAGEATLRARLLGPDRNPGLEGRDVIEAEDLSFEVDGAERSFEIVGNEATVSFLAFRDPGQGRLFYRVWLVVEGEEGRTVTFQEELYGAGPLAEGGESMAATVQSTERAPQTWEYAALGALGAAGVFFAWLVLGRFLFHKMLFGARMAVSTALTLSNLLLLGAFLVLVLALALAWFFPVVSGGVVGGYEIPYLGYVTAAGGYLCLLGLAWLLGWMAWR